MLQRNLVYTALTRAKQLAVLIGSKKALAMAVKNSKVRRRWSHLAGRLRTDSGLSALLPETAPENSAEASTSGKTDSTEKDSGADTSREFAQAWDERPPDSVYEGRFEEDNDGEDFPNSGSELTYHPVDD
jgi:hypothetical protein